VHRVKAEKGFGKCPRDVFEHGFGAPGQTSQQVTTLAITASQVISGACIWWTTSAHADENFSLRSRRRNDHAGIEQCRLHRPSPADVFLFDPRSVTRETNLPKPMTPRFFLRKLNLRRERAGLRGQSEKESIQFADEHCQSLLRRAIQARLNCRAHVLIVLQTERCMT